MAAIRVQNLTYFHGIRSQEPSLKNVNISLQPGTRTLLVGANGGQHLVQ